MGEVRVETPIEATAEAIWAVLTDLRHYADWNPFIRQVRGSLEVGGDVRVRADAGLAVPLRFSATVLAHEEARELRWRGHVGAPWIGSGEHAFRIEPIDETHVRFVQHEVFSGALPAVMRPVLERRTRALFSAMNNALKARVERHVEHAPRSAESARTKCTSWMLSERGEALLPARFESIGIALPERRVTTRELMGRARHRTKIDLERLTGIHERRVCSPGEDSLTLAIDAARDCLARSRYAATDLDMVICTSITRYVGGPSYRFEPPLSLSIKEAIGAHQAQSFDLSNACAGMLTGVFLLNDLIARGVIRRGMVVSGENITGLADNALRTIRSILSLQLASLTLGDAGAAVIVERAQDGPSILFSGFTTLSEHSRLCLGIPAPHRPGARMFTRAREIHKVSMKDAPPLIEEVLAHRGIRLGDIDWLIPHQTSVRAIRTGERVLAARMGERPKHMIVTVDEYGNTASTTLFLALHRYLSEGRLKRGDNVMLLSVASGLEVGIVIFEIDALEETHGHVH